MKEENGPLSHATVVWTFAAGYALRLMVALSPLRWLLEKVFPDDSYMYWQVARNILAGNGASLDGVNLTTAYHPLWMAPTLAVMALFDNGGDLPVHVSLVLSSTLDMATCWLVWKTAKLMTGDERLSLFAAALILFNPYHIGYVNSGLGDGLNALCVVAYLHLYYRIHAEGRDELLSWIALGLLAGLSMLARTDSVLFHLAVLVHLTLTREAKNLGDRLRPPLIVGLASCLLVVPWLLYMKGLTGHFMQTSASAHPWVNHMRRAAEPWWSNLLYSLGKTATAMFWNLPISAFFGVPAAALVAAWAGRRAQRRAGEETPEVLRRWGRLLALPLLAMMGLAVIHGGLRWFTRQWYFLPMAAVAPLWLAVLWQAYGKKLSDAARKAMLTLMILGFAGTVYRIWIYGNYPWQSDMYDMARTIHKVIPPADKPRIGGFNILMQAYYYDNQVMNLDGIGNDPVFERIKDHTLGDYIDEVGLQYIVDWDYYIQKRHGPHLPEDFADRLEPVIACGGEGSLRKWEGPMMLYRILPRGQTPSPDKTPIQCKRPG